MRSVYEGAKTKVRVDSKLSQEIEVKVRMHQGSALSPFLFAVTIDDITEFSRKGVPIEFLYTDDLITISEIIMGLRNKFLEWKEALESKGLKVNPGKTKVMVSGSIMKDSMSKAKLTHVGSAA